MGHAINKIAEALDKEHAHDKRTASQRKGEAKANLRFLKSTGAKPYRSKKLACHKG